MLAVSERKMTMRGSPSASRHHGHMAIIAASRFPFPQLYRSSGTPIGKSINYLDCATIKLPAPAYIAAATKERVAEVDAKTKATESAPTTQIRAPSTMAKAAYDYLTKNFSANGRLIFNVATTDGNVCHLSYRFFSPPDLSLRYDIDFVDVQLDTIKIVPGRSSEHWPGIALKGTSKN